MNGRAIRAIVRKDLKAVSQNKGTLLPMIMITVGLFVVAPLLVGMLPAFIGTAGLASNEIEQLLAQMPAGLKGTLAGYDMNQTIVIYALVYMLAPMFLLIPVLVSSVIAADSFAGEKERKTLEALLYTPTTDRELFTAKLLSGWLAAVAVALVGFVLYAVMANVAGWPQMGYIFFPNTMWLVLIIWVVPAFPGLVLGVVVLVSARAQGFQDASQLGGLIVLPVLLMLVLQVSGVMYFSTALVFLLGLVLWLLDGLLIWLGSRSFRRGRLLGA
jgi:ABC-2 type transport system permease protein